MSLRLNNWPPSHHSTLRWVISGLKYFNCSIAGLESFVYFLKFNSCPSMKCCEHFPWIPETLRVFLIYCLVFFVAVSAQLRSGGKPHWQLAGCCSWEQLLPSVSVSAARIPKPHSSGEVAGFSQNSEPSVNVFLGFCLAKSQAFWWIWLNLQTCKYVWGLMFSFTFAYGSQSACRVPV